MSIEKIDIEAGFNSCTFCRSGAAAHKYENEAGIIYLCDDHKAALYDSESDTVKMPDPVEPQSMEGIEV